MSSRAERVGSGLPLWPVAHLAHGRGPGERKVPFSSLFRTIFLLAPSLLSNARFLSSSSSTPTLERFASVTVSTREPYGRWLDARGKMERRRRYGGGRADRLFSAVAFPPPPSGDCRSSTPTTWHVLLLVPRCDRVESTFG